MACGALHLGEEAIGGLSAGIIGTIIGFPLDVVKTRMQTSQSASSHGIISMGSQIVRKEGVFALYKGIGPPLISLSILNTINFTSYSFFRQTVFQGDRGFDLRNGLAGMSCGPVASTVSTVENLVKVCWPHKKVLKQTQSYPKIFFS
jgi:solute carrier family 25 carnitine/acylcarnitine transporter 20/29